MLQLTQITKAFPGGFSPVLKQINLHLQPGDFCVLIGSNGSGKSTLLKTISGEYAPDQGYLTIHGEPLTPLNRGQYIASVIQDVNKGTISEMTLLENMALSLSRIKKNGFALYSRYANQIVSALKTLGIGLEQYLHYPLSCLSGGQRQMVATMMAVMIQPKLLLLDEHTSALDPSMQNMLMNYTKIAIEEHHLTCMMITHKLDDAIRYGNRLIMLHKGQIVFDVSHEAKASLHVSALLALFHQYEDLDLTESV